MNRKQLLTIVFFVILAVVAIIGFIQRENLLSSHEFTRGTILHIKTSFKSPDKFFFEFRFEVNGTRYNSTTGIECAKQKKHELENLVGKEFTVVYNTSNPNNCELLLSKNQFQKFNFDIPKNILSHINYIDSICNSDSLSKYR